MLRYFFCACLLVCAISSVLSDDASPTVAPSDSTTASSESTTPIVESLIALAMIKDEVVPDAINMAPNDIVKVSYSNGIDVNLGNELTPTQVKSTPEVHWTATPTSYYTLMMIDPDAPSRKTPMLRSFAHWLVGNIKGDDLNTGETLVEYVGSGPPLGSDLHRYVFLIYLQPDKVAFDEKHVANNSTDGRPSFSANTFATKYNLGNPIFGNFFQAQWDDYVPTVHEQLGFQA